MSDTSVQAPRRGRRSIFGIVSTILGTAMWILQFPSNATEIAAGWSSFYFQMSGEMARTIIVISLVLIGAWFLSPWIYSLLRDWQRKRRRAKEVAARLRSQIRDAEDYLKVAKFDVATKSALRSLVDGPKLLSPQLMEPLRRRQIVMLVGPAEANFSYGENLYRLNPFLTYPPGFFL